jgi:hypothetical protein
MMPATSKVVSGWQRVLEKRKWGRPFGVGSSFPALKLHSSPHETLDLPKGSGECRRGSSVGRAIQLRKRIGSKSEKTN